MSVDEMIRYLEDCPYSDRQEPQKIAAKLRAAEDLLHYSKIVATEIAGGGHDYHSHRLWETAEAYRRAGGPNDC